MTLDSYFLVDVHTNDDTSITAVSPGECRSSPESKMIDAASDQRVKSAQTILYTLWKRKANL